jgi:hypothetical protein
MNNFLISGHTKIDSYLTSQPNIPIWEFIKSIGLNNKLYYAYQNSAIYNIYYPNHLASDHFIKVRILKYLYDFAKGKGFKEEFVSTEEIISAFLIVSYSTDCIIEELDSLLQNSLLMSDKYNSDIELPDKITVDSSIRISNRGIYYFTDLINRFHYIDLVLQDTPIFSNTFYDLLSESFAKSDSSGNRNLLKRVKTAQIFCEYLNDQERKDNKKNENTTEQVIIDFNIGEYINSQCVEIDIPRIERAMYK